MPRARRLLIVLLALAVAIVAAAAVLPARWLLRLAPADGLLAVVDAEGTVWRGQAWLGLGHPETRRLLVEPIQWQWRGLSIEVRHAWLRGPLRLSPHWGGLRVSSQQAQLPASALGALGAPWNTLAPSGNLTLHWNDFDTRLPRAPGPLADLAWRDAGSALSPVAPLGSFLLRIANSDQGIITLDLSTERGPLRLTGRGAWNGRTLSFQGQAMPAPDATAEQTAGMAGLLDLIGPPRNGAHAFEVP